MKISNKAISGSRKWLVLLLFLLLGASSLFPLPIKAAEQPKNDAAKTASSIPSDYLIGSEDVLEISVWKNTDLSKVVIVRPDGKISLPLIGDVQATGLTPAQLHDEIVAKLKEYQETATVSVIVQNVNSYKAFIIGEVKTPGIYILKTKTTILQALSMAGGFTQFASKNKIMLIRQRNPGGDEKIPVRFDDLINADEKVNKNLVLRAGDTIFVP